MKKYKRNRFSLHPATTFSHSSTSTHKISYLLHRDSILHFTENVLKGA